MDILEQFNQNQLKEVFLPTLKPGDTVRVHTKVTEGQKTRVQVFEGLIISLRGSGPSRTVTVRRAGGGFSVERIFPLLSPLIEKIEVIRRRKVRRAKLTYLRADTKRRRVKEDTRAMEAHTEEAEQQQAASAAATAEATSASETKPSENQ
jgi:large subunit ribosomal protein L19